ncbi:phage tail protein [Paenibacillus soyae]|uniref:Tail fiber protein n=1 Tax=Paenibacillus soyae TaxID=2969249 RepID=A0A9X2SCZ1_9BACL|nr:tail fiber protein [Paenibacillus soyae]MCR2806632.1 tail fiber protein [Paenibacillus soyae]
MSESYIGEIKLFGFGFTPKNWLPCQGQLLPINQNQALFAILGTTYGGNGVTTFALPDLRGRVPVHTGNGVTLGQIAGAESHTLTLNEIPAHTHTVSASTTVSNQYSPVGNVWAEAANGTSVFSPEANTTLRADAIGAAGGSQPHTNMQPYLAMNYCICVNGIFPSQN